MTVSISKDASWRTQIIPMNLFLKLFGFVIFVALSTSAFHVNHHFKHPVALHAWSLPNDGSFALRSWYNEYNPTARVTVYNDPDPIERYSFVSVGSDWPSMTEKNSSQSPDSSLQKRRMNPFKRAWRRRSLRRVIAAARRS